MLIDKYFTSRDFVCLVVKQINFQKLAFFLKKKYSHKIQEKNCYYCIFKICSMNVQIIAIGDEILQGQTLNTNAKFLAKEMTNHAFSVEKLCTIGDTKDAIFSALDNSVGKYSIILMTGGLGPTSDDITKKVLAEYFDGELIENEEVLADVEKFVKNRGFEINDFNRKQALVPSTCEVIRNPIGTAPTMLFEKNNSIIISMPGVPFEMKQIFTEKVIPNLKSKITFPDSCIKFVQTFGIPESVMAEKLSDFEKELPKNIKIAFLPSPEVLKIKFFSFGEEQKTICANINTQIEKLKTILGKNIFGFDGITLEKAVAEKLIELKKTVSTAESCTGGHIGHKFTSIPGSSEFFCGGVVSYSNRVKIQTLGVKTETIENFGAVSEETVREMAAGALKLLKTDYTIAVSGVAGPGGGSKEKPVGTTWIAVGSKNKILSFMFKFGNRRDINIRRATATALFMLLNFIKEEEN